MEMDVLGAVWLSADWTLPECSWGTSDVVMKGAGVVWLGPGSAMF
jgi:hypothetical protein